MKMVIEKRILMEGLNCVSRALSTRNIIPVLNGIKFDLTKKGLYLTATDNDITIQKFIDKKDLIRVVKAQDGSISLDFTGKKSGRGAYICNDIECINKMVKNKLLSKAFETPIDDSVYQDLQNEFESKV